jgi:hypothetical protein
VPAADRQYGIAKHNERVFFGMTCTSLRRVGPESGSALASECRYIQEKLPVREAMFENICAKHGPHTTRVSRRTAVMSSLQSKTAAAVAWLIIRSPPLLFTSQVIDALACLTHDHSHANGAIPSFET